mmetsp:Transcript_26415/g.81282  ORF Transcript_26415/g.81282 Transcript_26415/m.81282 type:complete len:298 (-) Transcript_26415:398-1291(-)
MSGLAPRRRRRWLWLAWPLGGAWAARRSSLHRTAAYDREAFVFDPQGRVLQLEYAEAAAQLGGPVVAAVVGERCVVCAWHEEVTPWKILAIDDGTFCAFSGLRADGLALVDAMRVRAARERIACPEERPSPRKLARAVGDVTHEAARGGGRRCYGARLVVAGFDSKSRTPELWTVGPSGVVEASSSGLLTLAYSSSDVSDEGEDSVVGESRRRPAITVDPAWSAEEAVTALANVALADGADALQVLVFTKESSSSRLLAWRADLRRHDDLVDDGAAWRLHPEAAASLAAGLHSADDD